MRDDTSGWMALLILCGIGYAFWFYLGKMTDANVFTLHRSAITDAGPARIATFDAKGSPDVNRENCELVRGLFARQSRVPGVEFSCLPGRNPSAR